MLTVGEIGAAIKDLPDDAEVVTEAFGPSGVHSAITAPPNGAFPHDDGDGSPLLVIAVEIDSSELDWNGLFVIPRPGQVVWVQPESGGPRWMAIVRGYTLDGCFQVRPARINPETNEAEEMPASKLRTIYGTRWSSGVYNSER